MKNTFPLFYLRCQVSVSVFCLLCFCTAATVQAQDESWEDFLENISVSEDGEYNYSGPLLDDLAELHENPFNLNTVTQEELEQLPFLNDSDIEELLAYIYRYGPLQSMGELKLISQLDYRTRQLLSLFVYVAPVEKLVEKISLKNLLKKGHHEVLTRLDVPLYKQDGYKRPSDEVLLKNPNKIYLGNNLYHNLRYQYRYKNRLFAGFTAEKDAGEPFGSYGNKLYDHYSFHFLLKDCGLLKTLALGDYRLNFGEGLVVNTDFSLGKFTQIESGTSKENIKKFSSTAETSFFRGTAVAFKAGIFDISAFYSFLPMDATLRKDGTISSLKTDGLHRTLLELSKKNNVTEQSAGANLTWHHHYISVGITAFYQHFSLPFSTGTELYRRYYPSGKDFVNLSTDYRFRRGKFLFSGETAFSHLHRGWATLNRAVYRFSHKYSLTALQRLFTYQYTALRANCFSENSTVNNESGFYLGFEAVPLSELKISAYADYFYSPWYLYGISHTSEGVDAGVQTDWHPYGSRWNVSLRYQIKRKERYDLPYLYNKLRAQLQYTPVECMSIRLLGRYTDIRDIYGRHTHGYMAAAVVRWTEKRDRARISLSGAFFDSRDYKAPMSFYEPSLLYSFSFINLYGKGMRTSLTARWDITARWMLMMKFGMTAYFDRDEISSGLQRVEGNRKSDLSFQLRYKF